MSQTVVNREQWCADIVNVNDIIKLHSAHANSGFYYSFFKPFPVHSGLNFVGFSEFQKQGAPIE